MVIKGKLGGGSPEVVNPLNGSLTSLARTFRKIQLSAVSNEPNALVQVSVRVDEDLEDTTTAASGPLYGEVWIFRSGLALELDSGYCYGGIGQFRSVVGMVGNVNYNAGDFLLVEIANKSGSTLNWRIDYSTNRLDNPDMFAPLSTMKAPQMGARTIADSLPDQSPYPLTMTLGRQLPVWQNPQWWPWPVGRFLHQDDFRETFIKWGTVSGTISKDTTIGHYGNGSMKMLTGALAGNTASAKMNTPLPADQAYGRTGAKIIIGAWIYWGGVTTMRDFQLMLDVDDSVRRRLGMVRYYRFQATAAQNKLQYSADGGGSWVDIATLLIGDDYTWHYFSATFNYLQGADGTGYLTLERVRFDDYAIAVASVAMQSLATNSVQVGKYTLLVTCDTAVAISAYVGEAALVDATPNLGL